jgi:putative YhdH/YhfP family quinone oxidoreductase
MNFKSLIITETSDGRFTRSIVNRDLSELPQGELLIRVHYSALNYKDGLSATGHKGITRKFPHTPGIEAAGMVERSSSPDFREGDHVFVTGFDLGMNTSGAFAEYIRVPASWVLHVPEGLTCKECMTIGTAGLTAAYALYKMELLGQHPDNGPIVVTGSTGGVGSLSVAILAKAGYDVIACTGKSYAAEYLKFLGASEVQPREYADDHSGRPLKHATWAGAIDTVCGNTLTTLIKQCKRDGCVVMTGLLASNKLETLVYPFLLNGINLLGIGAGQTPVALRKLLWRKLTHEWNVTDKLFAIAHEVKLEDLKDKYIDAIMAGQTRGRVVVNLKEDCCSTVRVDRTAAGAVGKTSRSPEERPELVRVPDTVPEVKVTKLPAEKKIITGTFEE